MWFQTINLWLSHRLQLIQNLSLIRILPSSKTILERTSTKLQRAPFLLIHRSSMIGNRSNQDNSNNKCLKWSRIPTLTLAPERLTKMTCRLYWELPPKTLFSHIRERCLELNKHSRFNNKHLTSRMVAVVFNQAMFIVAKLDLKPTIVNLFS